MSAWPFRRSQVASLVEDQGDGVLPVDPVLPLVVHFTRLVSLDLSSLGEDRVHLRVLVDPLAGPGVPVEYGLDLEVLEVLEALGVLAEPL